MGFIISTLNRMSIFIQSSGHCRGTKPPSAALFLGVSLKNAASHCLQPQVLSIGKSGIQPIKW